MGVYIGVPLFGKLPYWAEAQEGSISMVQEADAPEDGSREVWCTILVLYMGGCQNCGPFLGTLNIRCRIIIGAQKGTIILTTTHIGMMEKKRETTIIS